MIIPKSFKALGRTFQVEKVADVHGVDYHGMCRPDDGRIMLVSTNVPRDKQEHVYLHEVVHLVCHLLGARELYENEQFVDSFAGILHQILTTGEGKQ